MKFKNIIANLILIATTGLTYSCNGSNEIPKEPTYLRPDLPKAKYYNYKACNYSFDISNLYKIGIVKDQEGNTTCHRDINLGSLNGIMHFSVIQMEKPLTDYIEYALSKVDEHKILASGIKDSSFYFPTKKVYGTIFEIEGNVASPLQFYLTDSTNNFVSGIVYFNAKPNYDSIRPSIEYLKKDVNKMISTFEWK